MGMQGGQLAFTSSVVSGLSEAAAGYGQSQAMLSRGRYDEQVARDNAAMIELQGAQTGKDAEYEAQRRLREAAALRGRQRAVAAAQGVDASSGAAEVLQAETQAMGALDAETIRNNAWRKIFGANAEADQLRRAGRASRRAAGFDAQSTALTGGLNFGKNLIQSAYLYDRFKTDADLLVLPPAGKSMSDPRNR